VPLMSAASTRAIASSRSSGMVKKRKCLMSVSFIDVSSDEQVSIEIPAERVHSAHARVFLRPEAASGASLFHQTVVL